jgi:hypothetical protein
MLKETPSTNLIIKWITDLVSICWLQLIIAERIEFCMVTVGQSITEFPSKDMRIESL